MDVDGGEVQAVNIARSQIKPELARLDSPVFFLSFCLETSDFC